MIWFCPVIVDAQAPLTPSKAHAEAVSTVLAVDASTAYTEAVSMPVVLVVDTLTTQAGADSMAFKFVVGRYHTTEHMLRRRDSPGQKRQFTRP